MYSNPKLLFGTTGDLLLYTGPSVPAIFVPFSMVRPLDGITYPLPAGEVLTGQTSLLLLGVLLPDVRDIRALESLPKSVPPGTAAFKLRRRTRCTYAYLNVPATAELDEWASRQRIHCLITPTSCRFTSLARAQPWFRDCALTQEWETMHDRLGTQEVTSGNSGGGSVTITVAPLEDDLR